ncbi:MAG: hypothetical protein PWP24_1724 [Clostridiales bacterium]|nr:hypothetical protein [Clostridiales bacterium]
MAAISNRTRQILHAIKIFIQTIFNVLMYILIILILIRLATAAYDFSYQIFGSVSVEQAPGVDMPIEIEKGEGTMALAQDLEDKGLIADKYTFYVRAKLSTGSRKPIYPGSYKLNTSMTYEEMIEVITNQTAEQTK